MILSDKSDDGKVFGLEHMCGYSNPNEIRATTTKHKLRLGESYAEKWYHLSGDLAKSEK